MKNFRSTLPFLLCSTFACTLLVDFLLFNQPLGCNAALAALLVFCLVLLRTPHIIRAPQFRPYHVVLASLALSTLYEPGWLSISLIAITLIQLAIASRQGAVRDILLLIKRNNAFLIATCWRASDDAALILKKFHARNLMERISGKAASWALPLILGMVFLGIFAVANPVLEVLLTRALETMEHTMLRLFEIPDALRFLFWTVCIYTIWSLLRTRVRNFVITERSVGIARYIPQSIERCLIVFNIIFFFQTGIDIVYLWGGAALPEGMTYAHFAHRGAYPLMVTALLAALFVLHTFRDGAFDPSMRKARTLVYAWIVQNLLLILSSIWRLCLYVDVYGLSRWRISAMLWMALVAVGFALIALRIIWGRSNNWLVRSNCWSAAALLYCCCFYDFDSAIAWHNVKHCREATGQGSSLDIEYLESLGPESVPALYWFGSQHPELTSGRNALLSADIQMSKMRLELANWRAWTLLRLKVAGPPVTYENQTLSLGSF